MSFSTALATQDLQQYPLSQNDARIQQALDYLRTLQNNDGGFSNPGEESSLSNTQWVIMALVAAGEDPHEWMKNGLSPIDYVSTNAKDLTGSTDYERMILALVAAGEDPRAFAGRDFVMELKKTYLEENGQFSDFTYTTIWGILALSSAEEDVSKSAEWLKRQQNADGGFAWVPGEKSDFDDTAAVIEALIAAGERPGSTAIRDALEYLHAGQNTDGGFRYFGSSPSNAASDAWVIQALVACGQDPRGDAWTVNGTNPVDHLLSLQQSDGSFYYTSYIKSNPGYMTVCTLMALLGQPHPIKPLPQVQTPEPTETAPSTATTPVTSTSVPTLTPTPTMPSQQPAAPTATMSSALTPEPPSEFTDAATVAGFEFLFCCSGLLLVAFIVLLRRNA
ncbi:MAG TPA: prenyltransferase/squalene oxidase repeat-containing protein [Desulfobacteria bacterium]|nr:prenyltransferase/squalene oxidase repeat-containing protein [Desulfobacteria bacterium]